MCTCISSWSKLLYSCKPCNSPITCLAELYLTGEQQPQASASLQIVSVMLVDSEGYVAFTSSFAFILWSVPCHAEWNVHRSSSPTSAQNRDSLGLCPVWSWTPPRMVIPAPFWTVFQCLTTVTVNKKWVKNPTMSSEFPMFQKTCLFRFLSCCQAPPIRFWLHCPTSDQAYVGSSNVAVMPPLHLPFYEWTDWVLWASPLINVVLHQTTCFSSSGSDSICPCFGGFFVLRSSNWTQYCSTVLMCSGLLVSWLKEICYPAPTEAEKTFIRKLQGLSQNRIRLSQI